MRPEINRVKAGQVSLFIIAGILMLLIAGFGWLIYHITVEKQADSGTVRETQPEEVGQILSFVDLCIKQTAFEGINIMARQGGYMQIPELIKYDNNAYWYYGQINIQPTLNETRIRLEEYINGNLKECIDYSPFEEMDFIIKDDKPKSKVIFGTDSVLINMEYPLTIEKGGSKREYNVFAQELDIRWRRIFELASEIINRELDPKFEFSRPLRLINDTDFDITASNPEEDILVYTITDRTREEFGENFVFQFANKFGKSELVRVVKLQDASKVTPTALPNIIYSVDRMAQLILVQGTTMALNASDVNNISVRQTYPENVTLHNVSFHKLSNNDVIYRNITWNITYPIYSFEPTHMRFNDPQRLVIYWDDDQIPNKGKIGIIWNEGEGWRPLPSKADYDQHYVYTDIPGFSSYTPVDCAVQPVKEVSSTVQQDHSGVGCYTTVVIGGIITAILIIVALAIIIVAIGKFGLIAGVAYSIPAVVIGTTTFVLTTSIIIVGPIVGGIYLSQVETFSVDDDAIIFTPTCDQNIIIKKDSQDAIGQCIPSEGIINVSGGVPLHMEPVIQKCSGLRKFLCGSCKLKCSTKYQ